MYSFDARVRYSECDKDGRLSLVAMINYLQDCSTFHSESLGIGFGPLGERGLAWVLGAWQIEIEELPLFNTPITVSTWCHEITHAHALRNFQILDGEGRTLVRADSQWLMFDTAKQRATRVPEDQRAYFTGEKRLDMAPFERKIRVPEGGRRCQTIVVGEQNLDTNRHVNNAQYVLFALDALAELGHAIDLARLSVQYRKMAWLGDSIVAVAHEGGGGWVVELEDEAGTNYALVRLQAR
jgi:acyl-ACP thioesterase